MTALLESTAAVLGVPTRTVIEAWDTGIRALDDAAASWRSAADRIDTAADAYVRQLLSPGATGWAGDAADVARATAYSDRGIAWGTADRMRSLAFVAGSGAQDLRVAQGRAVEAIAQAEGDGFAVADDLTVTDLRRYGVDEFDLFGARQAEAQAHQSYVLMRAGALKGVDDDIGTRLATSAPELLGAIPNGWTGQPPAAPPGRFRFTERDLFPHDPTGADIIQDSIGDCYLDSTMGAIANADPQWIKDRISYDSTTGSFDVTLWNGRQWTPITVSQDDIAADIRMRGASGRDNGVPDSALWPTVIECAYAKKEFPRDRTEDALGNGGIGRGGISPDAMEALTGNRGVNIKPEWVWLTNTHLDQEMSMALAQRRPVTVSSSAENTLLVPDHVYMLESISGAGNDAVVTLRNPWGQNLGTPSDSWNPLVTMRMGDLTGYYGSHPVSDVTIGSLG